MVSELVETLLPFGRISYTRPEEIDFLFRTMMHGIETHDILPPESDRVRSCPLSLERVKVLEICMIRFLLLLLSLSLCFFGTLFVPLFDSFFFHFVLPSLIYSRYIYSVFSLDISMCYSFCFFLSLSPCPYVYRISS